VLFADGTNLVTEKDETAQHKIKNVMKKLQTWLKNDFMINTEKKTAVSLHTKQISLKTTHYLKILILPIKKRN
jgi:hypothetical protein